MSEMTEAQREVLAGAEIGGNKGSPAAAPPAATNGTPPHLPPGTIQLPPGMVGRITRLLRDDPRVQDALYSFLEGRGDTGPYSLVVPVFLLVKPQSGQEG